MDISETNICMPTYWVYLFCEKRGRFHVGCSMQLPDKLRNQDIRLLYYRRFNNMIDSLGHKLLLEQLSMASLKRVIQKTNPRFNDLKHELMNPAAAGGGEFNPRIIS